MKLVFVGAGYVGLVSGTCFADLGNSVSCVDVDEAKIEKLKRGEMPIYEPGLKELFERNVRLGRLEFSSRLEGKVKDADAIFICVGTPSRSDGSADLKHVDEVARTIGKNLEKYAIVVDKSTVPVGTAERVEGIIREELEARNAELEFDVVSNPEFLKEGDAVRDFQKPDRIVVGLSSERARPAIDSLYSTLVRTGSPIIYTNTATAEMIKYASNAMLASRISFMNSLSNLCESEGADITMVQKGMAADKRIGPSFLFAGPGYGGSCFPKDVKALVYMQERSGHDAALFRAIDEANEMQKRSIVPRLQRYLPDLEGKVVALWGLTFKPRTDDMREAPSITIVEQLREERAVIKAYDPEGMRNAKAIFKCHVEFSKDAYDAVRGADALMLLTEWDEFREPDFARVRSLMRGNVLLDARNIYNPQEMRRLGFVYQGIGR